MVIIMNISDTLAYLQKHGHAIGKASLIDPRAKKIIQYYDLYYKCPEPGAEAFLIASVEEWMQKH